MPGKPAGMHFNIFDKGTLLLMAKPSANRLLFILQKITGDYKMDLLIYLPANATKAVPLLLNISFFCS
jgi:hypothetical protein